MPKTSASFWRDSNWVPIADDGVTSFKEITLSASNTTASVPLFTLTGSVEVRALYGVVTTVIGSNHTAAYWRLNDQTAQAAISLATGTTVSALPVGTILTRRGLVATALTATSSAAGAVADPIAATAPSFFMPFTLTKKSTALTQIEYTYSTTNTPTTGAIKFFVRWIPLSDDANLVAV